MANPIQVPRATTLPTPRAGWPTLSVEKCNQSSIVTRMNSRALPSCAQSSARGWGSLAYALRFPSEGIWRRERDSNPRYGFPYSGFQDRLFQPLTHPSACGKCSLHCTIAVQPSMVRLLSARFPPVMYSRRGALCRFLAPAVRRSPERIYRF